MLKIISHSYRLWADEVKINNGAYTYSKDIIESQEQHWKQNIPADKKIILSTAPRLNIVAETDIGNKEYDIAIQYLHTYPYSNPVRYIKDIVEKSKFVAKKWVFITAYKPYELLINTKFEDIVRAVHIPMSIKTDLLPQQVPNPKEALIYFGNIYGSKQSAYEELKTFCKRNSIWMDTISMSKFNGEAGTLSQEQIWDIVRQYRYGAGVGRCALEMMGIGLPVIITGAEFGGIMTSETDWQIQQGLNMNGRVITTDRTLDACWLLRKNIFIPKKECFTIGNKNHYLYLQEKGLL